jgi:protein translocase SecG subunit
MNWISITQTALAVLLIIAILLQQRGTGLSGTFGGDGSTYSTRRGAERIIFIATIVLAVLWVGISIARLLV